MVIHVDSRAIRARIPQRRRLEGRGVDLWVVVDHLDRQGSAAAVSAAAARQSDRELFTVYPTSGGTFVWLQPTAGWERHVSAMARDLTEAGHTGLITTPALRVGYVPSPKTPYPTALLAHRLDPPVTAGPFNQWGMPQFRWGVPAEESGQLFAAATQWVGLPGTESQVDGIAPMPVSSADSGELLERILTERHRTRLCSTLRGADEPRRAVSFGFWGQSAWTDVDPSRGPVDLAVDHADLLTHLADRLDVAAVRPVFAGLHAWDVLNDPQWMLNRHLWSRFVPDVHGIQLLTSEHLERAHDLASWQVSRVARDRWLVRARDLGPWYDAPDPLTLRRHQFPAADLRARAREEFGDMMLTKAAVAANPRPLP